MTPFTVRRARVAALSVVAAVLAALFAPGAAAAGGHAATNSGVGPPGSHQVPPGPGSDPWEPVPRDQVAEVCGLDPDLLEAAEGQFSQAFSVVRFGRLCWTGGGGASPDASYAVQSVTKTFGGVLVGMVATRSSLSDTDLVSDWLDPLPSNVNPDATIAHLLGTTGTKPNLAVDQKGAWAYDTLGSREINYLRDIMNVVIAEEPENFPGVTNVYQFAQQELFDVLGMQDSRWTAGGLTGGLGFGLNTSVHDMGRLGLLILRKGEWDGVRLIDEEYLYRMTHPSFADTNPGYGYLMWLNSATLVPGVAGTPVDNVCAPYATWREHPHEPFFETTDDYGGSPFGPGEYDIGVAFGAGLGGQYVVVHRGLDMVLTGRNVTGNGHQRLWDAVRPALVELDPVFQGDEDGFCDQYRRSAYAPALISGWAPRSKDDCLAGGWRYGPYRNQGQCVSSFARGGGR
ncbi:MAG: serine hydrolase domain-containing protein [Acidimicrobiales bacterium]